MSAHAVTTPQLYVKESARSIALRTRGHSHGGVSRLVSPGDIGELIKPFVFLDYFDADPENAPSFGFHPHSGIATLTLILSGQAFYKETTDRQGVIETGGVEWMRASSGVWHTGGMYGKERIKGFQLWVAMPPALELAEPNSQYLVVFEEGDQAIQFEALTDAGFVLGSAVKHPYDLVTGHYSVHTNAEALRIGENNIAEIGRRLHNQGVLRRPGR